MVRVFLIETANKGQHLRVGLVHFVICYKSVDVSHLLRNSHAGRWLGFATTINRKWRVVIWQSCGCVFRQNTNPSRKTSRHHI